MIAESNAQRESKDIQQIAKLQWWNFHKYAIQIWQALRRCSNDRSTSLGIVQGVHITKITTLKLLALSP